MKCDSYTASNHFSSKFAQGTDNKDNKINDKLKKLYCLKKKLRSRYYSK